MGDIISFVAVQKSREPQHPDADYVMVTAAVVRTQAPLEEGNLVALGWLNKDGSNGEVIFARWLGPTGRDGDGRFVKKGSPDEHHLLDSGLRYCPARMGSFRILGKVAGGMVSGTFTPEPCVS